MNKLASVSHITYVCKWNVIMEALLEHADDREIYEYLHTVISVKSIHETIECTLSQISSNEKCAENQIRAMKQLNWFTFGLFVATCVLIFATLAPLLVKG